jgi:eukaryotic-like serine/threonine-protein kinase
MDAARWRIAFDVFNRAIAQDLSERPEWLANACAGDTDLHEAVERLIVAHESAPDFLEMPAALRVIAPHPDRTSDNGQADDTRTLFDTSALLADFVGTAPFESTRFALRRVIGAGGMGIVYEAYDRERRQIVALKTIRRASPGEVYYLKREFRGLSDVAHRNLVSLYELVVEGSQCFFTMELVDGVDVVSTLQRTALPKRFTAIRDMFGQIAEGVAALHRHGRLHRDIKPSNVLVASDGRVVILDFGLITDTGAEASTLGVRIAGTPAYMAPEDIAGDAASELSDWYSVGITLYQALTGHVPFVGPFEDQYHFKTREDPPEPATVVGAVPPDLSSVCANLISRDHDRRRAGRDALLRPGSPANRRSSRGPEADGETPFVGREAALATLGRAFSTVQSGRAVSVLVHGPSGIGKSALVRKFLDRVRLSFPVVVLRGRCYEREAVPYKALDGIIDSLGQYLNSLSSAQRDGVLPRDLVALSQMFPALTQVDRSADAPSLPPAGDDPVLLRRRGLAALRQLLTTLAAQHVILFIDDLHWADADSVALLDELLRPPDAPPLLTFLCFRSEESASQPFLQSLLSDIDGEARVSLPLNPMSDVEATTLIESLGVHTSIGSADWVRMTHEAEGNPLLLKEVAHYVADAGADAGESLTFAAMLRARLDALSPAARQFLDALAICGRPTPPQVVFDACGFAGDERPLVAGLRSAHLLRSSGSTARVELYHDRIRSTLATFVPPGEAKSIHRAMADALVARQFLDPEDLFEHYVGADDPDRASAEAVRAAARASESLAFERAAHFYRRALALTPAAPGAGEWKRSLAIALANAGRPAEAAAFYLEAADACDANQRIDLQRRAAEQLLVGGHIDRGLAVIRSVLSAVRVPLRRGPRSAFLSVMMARLRLWRRGLEFVPREEHQVAERDLQRIDTCWSIVAGLSMVDPIRAADCQSRHLLLALDAGEPYRVARALALQVGFQAAGHGLIGKRSFVEPAEAQRVAERVGDPHAIALATLTAGMSAAMRSEWKRSSALCERALTLLREHCAGATWEINQAYFFFLGSLLYQGELREVSRQMPELLASARERGNLYFETELRTRMNLVWLAADEPDEGARQAREAIEAWAYKGFQRQHYNLTLALVQTALYRGDADAAWQLISESWGPMKRTFLLHIPTLRVETSYMRARSALKKAEGSAQRGKFLTIVHRDIRRIRREQMAWAEPVATLLGAAAAFCEGRRDQAARDLELAADRFARVDMHLYVAAARRRLGAIAGGAAGDAMIRSADDWMTAQQIRNPAAMVRLLAPGFAD